MSLVLQATTGPVAGTKIVVARGQVLRVGRTKWADRSLSGDASLADVHFAIDFRSQHVLVQDLSGDRGTLLNGEKVAEAQIHTGDRIEAGQTTFSVLVQGEPPPAPDPAAQAADETESPAKEKTARDYARKLDLGAEAMALLEDDQTPGEFLDLLIAQDLFAAALKFLAFWLPKPLAVAWGCDCLESVAADRLPPPHREAFSQARKWSVEPNEKNRRKAEAAAETANYDGPASFLAAAAFWSGGSLAPEGLAEVPPEESLTAQAVSAALLMAGTWGPPTQTANRYRAFLQGGKKLAASQEAAP
jgi:predicted component of type VI protein secretion system